jgi:hypothetical protein
MAERKYEPRQQANGKWAVYDLSTGFPTVVNGFFTIDLPRKRNTHGRRIPSIIAMKLMGW